METKQLQCIRNVDDRLEQLQSTVESVEKLLGYVVALLEADSEHEQGYSDVEDEDDLGERQ